MLYIISFFLLEIVIKISNNGIFLRKHVKNARIKFSMQQLSNVHLLSIPSVAYICFKMGFIYSIYVRKTTSETSLNIPRTCSLTSFQQRLLTLLKREIKEKLERERPESGREKMKIQKLRQSERNKSIGFCDK